MRKYILRHESDAARSRGTLRQWTERFTMIVETLGRAA